MSFPSQMSPFSRNMANMSLGTHRTVLSKGLVRNDVCSTKPLRSSASRYPSASDITSG